MLQTAPAGRESLSPAAGRRTVLFAGLCVVLAALASSSVTHEALLHALAATQSVIEQHTLLGVVTFVVLAALSATVAFASVAVIVPAAVFAWGAPVSIGLLWLGWILGGAATYAIGRYLGRQAARWPTAERALLKLEAHLAADTPLWLITLLQLALPSELPGYVLGLVRYPIARYLIALAVAELPFTVATVYLGNSFVEGRSGLILAIGASIAFGSVCAAYALRRVMSEAR
jgi:uncharacterized membrane protein YdjX (TVP38/TMEM64 family)